MIFIMITIKINNKFYDNLIYRNNRQKIYNKIIII